MNQSAFIAGGLLAGFVLYLAAKGRLGAYESVLWGATAPASPASGAPQGGPGPGAALTAAAGAVTGGASAALPKAGLGQSATSGLQSLFANTVSTVSNTASSLTNDLKSAGNVMDLLDAAAAIFAL